MGGRFLGIYKAEVVGRGGASPRSHLLLLPCKNLDFLIMFPTPRHILKLKGSPAGRKTVEREAFAEGERNQRAAGTASPPVLPCEPPPLP